MQLKKTIFRFVVAAFALASAGFAFPSLALVSDDASLIEGAKLCTRYLPRHERQFGIPVHLLAAIASTESGRYNHALGMNLPWPWTINVEGRGYFFDTKQEAIAAVQSLQSRGIQSIDVGCMQVNLHHHPYAFANLDQAFDPAYNVGYAAQFLKRNFQDENGSWRKATADYHSRSLMFGEPYARLVYSAWSKIINKVADARAGRPVLVASASANSPHIYSHISMYHAPHMHSISVVNESSRSEATREHGVLVIRPQSSSDYAQQQASEDEAFVRGAIEGEKPVAHAQQVASTDAFAPSASGLKINAVDTPSDSRGPQIIRIGSANTPVPNVTISSGTGSSSAKGQFQPSAHVSQDSSDASTASKPANTFVFDN